VAFLLRLEESRIWTNEEKRVWTTTATPFGDNDKEVLRNQDFLLIQYH